MKNIVFIHGMFQNPKSWEKWIAYFSEKGYKCVAPAWPYHEGEPAKLRQNPAPELGYLTLDAVLAEVEKTVASTESPILIGHSVGGLIVQLLINKGIGEAGVCIDSVAPNAMLSFDWGFLRNSAMIVNPLKGDEPFLMDLESFHGSFCNTMTIEETEPAFETYATHDSRNVLRGCMGDSGKLDLDLPHAPLLFVGGEEDEIIPADLNEKNAEAYTDESSITSFVKFPGRSHFICGEPGWEEVAATVYEWLQQQETVTPTADTSSTF